MCAARRSWWVYDVAPSGDLESRVHGGLGGSVQSPRKRRGLILGWIALALVFNSEAGAQWLHHRTPGTPRLADGSPNLSAAAPRTPEGKPDLSGIWDVVGDAAMPPDGRIRSKYLYDLAADLPGGAPLQPWAKALYDERRANLGVGGPSERCLPHGIPNAMLTRTLPFKIAQMPALTIILFEEFNNWRQIFTDARALPEDPQPAWLGYSIGQWEDDTFIVETAGFNDRSWLDASGMPHSEALHTTERFRRIDFGHLELRVTLDDSRAFTRPWSVTLKFNLQPDTELLEHHCENEKWSSRS
jgi:hypothetical protein